MTRALTRTPFHSSQLIRILADLALLDAVEPGGAFAEKLGLWVAFRDAITLSAALTASPPVTPSGARLVSPAAVRAEFDRVRATLVSAMTKTSSPGVGRTRTELPAPSFDEPLDVATGYESYRRYYLAHQRDMEANIRPLRAKVRGVLLKASPALQQLATLDAALDGILAERESKLLATIPSLLVQRFGQLLKARQQGLAETPQADHPDFGIGADGWLTRFRHEFQTVLLAELDVRLQPTLGLVEAFNNEMKT